MRRRHLTERSRSERRIASLSEPRSNDSSSATSIQTDLVVMLEDGLHMRVASRIVQLVRGFESAIEIRMNGVIADAKSLLDLLTLAADRGSRLHVVATGPDAALAMERLLTGLPPEEFQRADAS